MSTSPATVKVDVADLPTTPLCLTKLYLILTFGGFTLGFVEFQVVFLGDYKPTTQLIIGFTTSVLYLLVAFTLRITKMVDVDSDPAAPDYFTCLFVFSWLPLATLAHSVHEYLIPALSPQTKELVFPVMMLFYGPLFTLCAGVGWRLFLQRLVFYIFQMYLGFCYTFKFALAEFGIGSEPCPSEMTNLEERAQVLSDRAANFV